MEDLIMLEENLIMVKDMDILAQPIMLIQYALNAEVHISARWFAWSKYSNASRTDYNAQAGQHAFGDSSKGLYGCGCGYRSSAANTGDGWGQPQQQQVA